MRLQLSTGVINQKLWPAAGDVDDCWAVANMTAVHACAPWLRLPDITKYRNAAGNPDDPRNPDGGTIRQNARATRTLWPALGKLIEVSEGDMTYARLEKLLREGHPASVFVVSKTLPLDFQYGFGGLHAVAFAFDDGEFRIANPLAPAHSRWRVIQEGSLEIAVKSWPGKGAYCIVFPTIDEAVKALIADGGLTQADVEAARSAGRSAGYAAAKDAALAAVKGI